MKRRDTLLSHVNVATQHGMEIGPLRTPVVTRDMGHVVYVDHTDTPSLRKKYAGHFDVSEIVDIDHVWPDERLSDITGRAVFDYVVASHVIEHVPDLIGWLDQLAEVLKPGGKLCLAVPDKRYCFDIGRPTSSVGDILDSHLSGRKTPAYRHIYDYHALVVQVGVGEAWHGTVDPRTLPRYHTDGEGLEKCLTARDCGDYVDVHCWVFTPRSFIDTLATLTDLGLHEFRLVAFVDTDPGQFEFFVTLERLDPALEAEARQAKQRDSFRDIACLQRDFETEPHGRIAPATLARLALAEERPQTVHALTTQLEAAERRAEELATRLEATERSAAGLATQLESMRGSTSWKITSPLRSAKTALAARLGSRPAGR